VGLDWRRLRRAEVVVGVSAVLLLVSLFVDWYGVKLSVPRVGSVVLPVGSVNAWDAFTVVDVYLAITAVLGLMLFVAQAAFRAPAIPVSLSVIVTVLGGVAAAVVLWRIVDPPGISGAPAVLATHLSRTLRPGAFIGLAAAIGIFAGGYRSMRTEGIRETDGPGEIETVHLGDTEPASRS
jgi:hypothetical protein